MEYNIRKHMRQRHLPTQTFLTVKFYLAIVLIITLHSRDVLGSTLGSKCQHDMDCTDFIKGSSCSAVGYCECAPYYVQYNTTTCLSSQLLGGDCALSEQCTMKVANSSCLDGACRCVEGFLQFRKHTCLGPAPPGSVCYSHAHCQMFNARTHCDFLIPNLFGRCQCTAPTKLKGGLCLDNTIEEAHHSIPTNFPTTTSTTPVTSVKETEAALSTTQEPELTPAHQQVLADSIVPTISTVQESQEKPEENSNISIEEQEWKDSKYVQPTSKIPLETQTESLTPAEVDEQHQHETIESTEALDIANVSDDYPYKIEEEEDHTHSQKQEHSNDHIQETSIQEEEEHVEDYSNVVDNTMNFDYEAAQEEMEDHIHQENKAEEEVEQSSEENLEQEIHKIHANPENHEQEPERDIEKLQFNNHQQATKLEPEQHEFHSEYEQEEEIKTQHQQENELQPEEHTTEQHQIEHEQEQHQQYVPVQESVLENNHKETSDLEQEQHFEQEQEKEEQQVHEEINEKPKIKTENEPVEQYQEHGQFNDVGFDKEQVHEPELQHDKTEDTIYEQNPSQVHEEVDKLKDEQDHVGYQESSNEQESDNVYNHEQEQDSINNESPQFHGPQQEQDHTENQELAHKQEPEQFQEKEQESEQSHEVSYEQASEKDHELEAEQQEEHEESLEAINQPESDQEQKIQNPEHENINKNERYEETERDPEQAVNYELEQQVAQEHKQIKKENYDTEQQATEEQNKNIEHNDNADYATKQDYIAQLDYIIPGTDEINNTPTKKHHKDNQEESLSEKLNVQSITNEIHYDQLDEVTEEIESVQNENEATTQPPPEALTLSNNEDVTTQSAELEEEDKSVTEAETENDNNNNKEIDFKIGQEQQLVDASVVVRSEEENLVSQQINENNTAEQKAETSLEQEQQQLILQQTTEQIPEVEKHTNADSGEPDHDVFENFEKQQTDKQNEISTELPIETDPIIHDENNVEKQTAFVKEEQIPIVLDEENPEEQHLPSEAGVEEIRDQIAEHHNISEEEQVMPDETLPAIESVAQEEISEQPHHLEEDAKEEQKQAEELIVEQQRNEDLLNSQSAFLTESSLEDSKHVENTIEHEEDQEEEEDIKENLNEVYQMENEKTDIYQEQQRPENLIQNTENYKELENDDSEIKGNLEHQETKEDNKDDNLIESTTLSEYEIQDKIEAESLDNMKTKQNNEKVAPALEVNEYVTQQEPDHFNVGNEHKIQDEEYSVLNKDEQQIVEANQYPQIADVHNFNSEPITSNEEVQQATEAFETNYVPSKITEEKDEQTVLLADRIDDNEVTEREPPETENKLESENEDEDAALEQNTVAQAESEEIVYDNQPENVYFSQDQIPEKVKPDNEDFKESESISDILNNLMKEDITSQPEYSEESNFNGYLSSMQESDVPDLLAEDTNISEESVMSQQLPTKDSTEAPLDPEDKLITFYPDMQEVQPVQQQPVTYLESQQEPVEEASGDDEKPHLQENEIVTIDEHNEQKEHQTLSPLELPFDTSVDYEPQQFEADNLIIETTTLSASALKLEENNEQAESTTAANDIEELTTQTMLNLANRVTLMEPAAPIATTLKPLLAISANDEVTAIPFLDTPIVENLTTTKPITEIRKRVELSLEAVSLGLSCLNDKQCQLADPHTVCNSQAVCDCAANSYSAKVQKDAAFAQCGAKRTGCAPGTFQCRSSGVCISWFFVCDGRSDCNDASDEECTVNARLNQACPSEAFQCGKSGRCISRAALCDGRKQCPHGEDEIGCNALKSKDSCPHHTFRCTSGECIPEYEYCNAIISCRDGSDEPPHLCGSRSMPNFFLQLLTAGGLMNKNTDNNVYCPHRCSNGRCRSTAIVCSGRDGCGDGTDEQTCSVCRCPAVNTNRSAINVSEFFARHRPMPLW